MIDMTATKPWFQSTTIWGGAGGIAIGLAILVATAAGLLPPGMELTAAAQIGAGVTSIVGRLRAKQAIGR